MRVGHVAVRVGCRCETEGVGTQVGAGGGVVVALVVVVQAGFGVVVLAGESQRGLGAAGVPEGAAPDGVLLVSGQGAVGGGQFRRGTDQVGDDSVEPAVDLILGGIAGEALLSLGDRG